MSQIEHSCPEAEALKARVRELEAALARRAYSPNAESALEVVESLDEDATIAEKDAAVTDNGKCLICGLAWRVRDNGANSCPHDEVQVIAFLRTIGSPHVDCICSGCPRKVPMLWMSGMCEPCAQEDCEHTDGAMAVAAERDVLLGDVQAVVKRWETDEAERDAARAEAAALRAVLEDIADCDDDGACRACGFDEGDGEQGGHFPHCLAAVAQAALRSRLPVTPGGGW